MSDRKMGLNSQMYETTSSQIAKNNPAFTFHREHKPNLVFPADLSIRSRETPGPGTDNPLKYGIRDKIILQQARITQYSGLKTPKN